MTILITGATGFLGQYVVAEALKQGYSVRAVVRPSSQRQPLSWFEHPKVTLVSLDLQQSQGIVEALSGVEQVIHLAAAKTGDFQMQFAGTVLATENLLEAMKKAQVWRLIAVSSFSVYDYLNLPSGTTMTEMSPLESHPQARDSYAQTKLMQEEYIRAFAQKHEAKVAILRPGVIYGRDHLWNACLGAKIGDRFWLRIGNQATLPLIYVENCADAIIKACQNPAAIGQTLNLVDDDLPTQKIYSEKLRQQISAYTIFVNLSSIEFLAQAAEFLFQGRMKLPSILIPARLQARFKPLQYSNQAAKQVLGWTPRYSLDTALERSYSRLDLLNVA